ncbi:AI-2E family transporter [Antarcticibacterium flavum]|uniref:AI-2E family transporter n=1 Tax=Antarcticibacterium flavum TaxID=2058175 RepID=A0A5B7X5P4_9FLAO|nr:MULTISPECIES: AI-2E family transporter [Antarcticibacterium]MCM4161874.1 AI-2E family transporter [Antarcticibacterium sp. W02-3]QCY70032.1 AI-2E family transporter [Antarcticibacterium flavum]
MPEKPVDREYTFVQKVWIVGGITALIVILLLLFEATFNVLILIFAGILIASYFRGISHFIRKKTGWPSWITLSISTVGSFLLVIGLFWLIGATVGSQAAQLEETLPAIAEDVEASLRQTAVGQELVEKIEEVRNSGEMTTYISRFFATTFGFLGDFYIILIIGIFFTASPQLYKNGITQLVPPRGRPKAEAVQKRLATGLKKWLAGKFIAMFAVFILTAIGLVIIGIPMWLTLALLAGLLNFVPNFGPLAAMIPAVLVGLAVNPTTALIIAIMYIAIQLLESSIINPQAQKKLIKIPPALIIISQLLIGALSGIWGVILATPLVLMVIILVQELYIKRINREE